MFLIYITFKHYKHYVLIYITMFCYIYFHDVVICGPIYGCKYRNKLCYKAPLCGIFVMSLWLCYHVIMWLCYHDVTMSCGLALSRMIIVNTIRSCDIKLHYAICCHVDMMFLSLEQIFHCKYCIELCYKYP